MSQTTAWLVLVIAGLLEVAWAIGLKYTEGFTRLWPSVGTLAALATSMILLAQGRARAPDRNRLRGLGRDRCAGSCRFGHRTFSRARGSVTRLFPRVALDLDRRS